MNRMSRLLLAALPFCAGCVHALPPPPTPGLVLPVPSGAPLPPGRGRIYMDVADGPTDVRVVTPVAVEEAVGDEVYDETVFGTLQECRTPCVFDVPLGYHLFAFPMRGEGGLEVERLAVTSDPTLYRRALGWRQSGGAGMVLGVLGTTFGGMSLATGATFLPIGLATDKRGFTTAGAITLGVGAVLTAVGIWAIRANPEQVQPGAGAQYPLPP